MGSKPRLRPLNPNSKISMKDLDSLRNLLQPPGRILEQGVQDGTNWVLSREDGRKIGQVQANLRDIIG